MNAHELIRETIIENAGLKERNKTMYKAKLAEISAKEELLESLHDKGYLSDELYYKECDILIDSLQLLINFYNN